MDAASAGAAVATRYFLDLSQAGVRNKHDENGYQGIVTDADLKSEQAIVAAIRAEFPDDAFLAEEEHAAKDQPLADRLWIIDPLDGTNNFAHGIPHYAISIAYYENLHPVCGCIVNPENGDVFTCERGRGAWYNNERASVNQHRRLSQTIIGVGFYYDRGAMMRATLKAIDELFQNNIHGIRRMGTAALDIVQVGLGRFGGFFEYQLSPWDFAAARLFVIEAGGTISTCHGTELPLEKSTVLATNGPLHNPLLNIVSRYVDYERQ
jgi:myo-inositol-1(or 4)-monophosphatase